MVRNQIREDEHNDRLLVEGPDDEHLFKHLLGYHGILSREGGPFKVIEKGGFEKIRDDLKTELKGSGLKRLGIVVDADTDIASRWDSLRNRLIDSGYSEINVPGDPDINGTVIRQEELPIVGIWLMPDNDSEGKVENFVRFLMPPDDLLWPFAQSIVQKVIETQCHFRPTYKIKAEVHTWLAWQEEPGRPMGLAVTKGY